MGATSAIDKQISNYLVQLNPRQKKAVLTVVKTFIEEQDQEYSPWKDPGFEAEMDRRVAELESGKVKGYGWEEVKLRARQSVKAKKKK
jgi:hypothetical protein